MSYGFRRHTINRVELVGMAYDIPTLVQTRTGKTIGYFDLTTYHDDYDQEIGEFVERPTKHRVAILNEDMAIWAHTTFKPAAYVWLVGSFWYQLYTGKDGTKRRYATVAVTSRNELKPMGWPNERKLAKELSKLRDLMAKKPNMGDVPLTEAADAPSNME